MIADFIPKREASIFSESIQAGILMHRAIDYFTDNHEVVRAGTRRLHADFHKYSPVVIDIFYDYLLAKNWNNYCQQPSLGIFAQQVYQVFEARIGEFPDNLQLRLPRMIAANWLEAYGTEVGMRYTFQRLSQRETKFPMDFSTAFDILQTHYKVFEEEFNVFLPEIQLFLKQKYVPMATL